jgi:dipeptidyl aminopeptidase/acylaminoacyl peptidase
VFLKQGGIAGQCSGEAADFYSVGQVANFLTTSETPCDKLRKAIGSRLPGHALPISRTHGNRVVRWSPDGKALAFIDGVGGVANIWLQPLDGRPARRLTEFVDGTMATFDWSRDGSHLAWIRVRHTGDAVALDLDKRRP